MTDQPIKFQYQEGIVSGGYSFSAYNNIITLSGFVESLDEKIREAIQYEAITARSLYVDEVKRLRASGEKVNSVLIKRDATRAARERAHIKYSEVWSEVEAIYKSTPLFSVGIPTDHTEIGKPEIAHLFIVAVSGSTNLFDRLMETVKTYNETAPKVVDGP